MGGLVITVLTPLALSPLSYFALEILVYIFTNKNLNG